MKLFIKTQNVYLKMVFSSLKSFPRECPARFAQFILYLYSWTLDDAYFSLPAVVLLLEGVHQTQGALQCWESCRGALCQWPPGGSLPVQPLHLPRGLVSIFGHTAFCRVRDLGSSIGHTALCLVRGLGSIFSHTAFYLSRGLVSIFGQSFALEEYQWFLGP